MERRQASETDGFTDDDPSKRNKDNEFRICTWNVRSLNRPRAAEQLAEALDCYKADITAIQEMRWEGPGKRKLKTHDIYYGDCNRQQGTFGCGFIIGVRLRQNVLSFNCVNERLTTIRIKAKFTNISLICAHAPTEEKDDTTKDNFYELLEKTYEQIPSYDIKIVLGDFNAKLGREDIFGSTVGKHSLHYNTSDNGFRLVDFAAGQNVVIASTRFPHLKIHKGTWKSPDQSVNQIDHIAIDARHSSSIMDVRTFRGANIDSDHYLVVANVRMRISRPSPTQGNTYCEEV
ncbi:craniofacial development protein 2-like [Episyrphus balteatus]|uniref:craniofacial development protein 2-like n=1 Tax=Episyrphus balteatus TaxID=286459 RepID=UPI002486119E|nr:craniofacial development protein 2-like [Episyrphus balteatus]